jgi:hypothetical protein
MIFLLMAALNVAALVAHVERNTSGEHVRAYFTWPLVYQRQAVGSCSWPRAMGEPFKPNEWRVIEGVAYHISAAVHDLLLDRALHGATMTQRPEA